MLHTLVSSFLIQSDHGVNVLHKASVKTLTLIETLLHAAVQKPSAKEPLRKGNLILPSAKYVSAEVRCDHSMRADEIARALSTKLSNIWLEFAPTLFNNGTVSANIPLHVLRTIIAVLAHLNAVEAVMLLLHYASVSYVDRFRQKIRNI